MLPSTTYTFGKNTSSGSGNSSWPLLPRLSKSSVPVDVVLTVDVTHERPSDLVLTIDNFNGYGTTLWDGTDDAPSLEMVVYAFPSDDEVHGEYTVRLTDTVPGESGTLHGWDLLVTSIYD